MLAPWVTPRGERAPGPRCALRQLGGAVVPALATSWVRRTVTVDARALGDQAVRQRLPAGDRKVFLPAHLELSWGRGADYFRGEMRLRSHLQG